MLVSFEDGAIEIWQSDFRNPDGWDLLRTIETGQDGRPTSYFTQDELSLFITMPDGSIERWRANGPVGEWVKQETLREHQYKPSIYNYEEYPQAMITRSSDKVCVWDITDITLLECNSYSIPIKDFAFTPDGEGLFMLASDIPIPAVIR